MVDPERALISEGNGDADWVRLSCKVGVKYSVELAVGRDLSIWSCLLALRSGVSALRIVGA